MKSWPTPQKLPYTTMKNICSALVVSVAAYVVHIAPQFSALSMERTQSGQKFIEPCVGWYNKSSHKRLRRLTILPPLQGWTALRLESLESRIFNRASRNPNSKEARAESARMKASRAENGFTTNMTQLDLEPDWVKIESVHKKSMPVINRKGYNPPVIHQAEDIVQFRAFS